MKKNIGLFDMALALSVNKIGSQFDELMEGEIIPSSWGFLTDKNGNKILNDTTSFETNLKNWKDAFDTGTAARIQELKAAIKAEKAKAKPDREKLNKLRDELESLEDSGGNQEEFKQYDCAIDANIDSYDIQVISSESQKLIFIITIDSGTLYVKEYDTAIKAEKIVETKFNEFTYAFLVAIGNRVIKTHEMALSEEDRNLLITEGITDNVFNVEAIFIDFQNSNISAYDKQRSSFPEGVSTTWFQVIMNNYFSNLNKQDNPFILGYKVVPKRPLKNSLFKPTAIAYSTTASSETRSHAFNFLMQIDNHALPEDRMRGYMPKSLIEVNIDKDKEINGVFAIDYNTFVKKYIDDTLLPTIIEQLHESLNKILEGYSINQLANKKGFRCQKGNLFFEFKLESMSIQSILRSEQEAQGIRISWDLVIDGNQHVEKPVQIIIIDGGTVGVDMPFSTHGEFPIDGKKGKKGKLLLDMTAGADGKLDLISKYDKPEIGTNQEKPVYKNDLDKSFDTLLDFINPILSLGGLLMKVFRDNSIHIDLDNDKFSYLDLGTMTSFSSRVVLPGSNTYTFKTVRLLTGKKDEDDAVIFDIAYAPKAESPAN